MNVDLKWLIDNVNNRDDLETLKQEEIKGKKRPEVIREIQTRIDQLQGDRELRVLEG